MIKIGRLAPGDAPKPAPITHRQGPFRLKKTAEMISKTFLDSFEDEFPLAVRMDIDKPWPGHLGDLPDYMPAQMPPKRLLFEAFFADGDEPKDANAIVGTYGGLTVIFDTKKHAADRRLDFSAFNPSTEWPQTGPMVLSGNVAIAIVSSPNGGALVCFDRKSGETYWLNEGGPMTPKLLIDGYLVAITPSPKNLGREYLTDLVILDAVNGKEVSRERGLKIQSVMRWNEKELRAGSFTTRFSFEIVRPL